MTQIDPLGLRVDDTKADGYHPAVRLITYDANYDQVKWPWHHYTSSGTTAGGHEIWETSARDLNNIEGVKIQVARFNGSDYIDGCTTFPKDNPYS
ncbi:hypothetical protein [Streptomyces sp. NBC_01236]|uniref:hypothetical protein n=1 Tax=Streptomyces sp. NBC_01236 TaxID=2903789 RepID=UPI002E13F071|nr:hypothetical protein OG324_24980 [Streptomyces sp. NBC_01236]